MSVVPVLQDEINRKAMETLEWLFLGLHKHRLTVEQFSTGIDTIFMAIAGLCNDDIMDLMTAADIETRDETDPRDKRVYVRGRAMAVIERSLNDDAVRIRVLYDGEYKKDNHFYHSTPVEANKMLEIWHEKLVAQGFEQI